LSSLFPDLYEKCLTGLVEARKRAGITQTELAAHLQRPQSFVAKYEGGERSLEGYSSGGGHLFKLDSEAMLRS
jgi:hypothetical protein